MAAQVSRPPQIEPTDPLYIHPSDSRGQALVANIFNGENYDGWKRSVMIALSARHKVAFIDGSCSNPAKQTQPSHQEMWKPNQRKPDSRRTNLFCDHCKRPGHTIDRCYKIHGYPNTSNRTRGRGREGPGIPPGSRAYIAWTEKEQQEGVPDLQNPVLPGLNPEQSKKLCQFLSNLTSTSQPQHNEPENIGAHMAGEDANAPASERPSSIK